MLSERARRSIGSVLLLVCVGAALPGALGQTTRPQETFRSGVSILELAASVLDTDGIPVRDLRENDFDVTIGGSERKVVVARFRESSTPADSPASTPATQPSFGSNASGRPGQVIVLAVDAESLKSGHERLMLDAAARLLQSLGPEDAVGLLAIPGKSVDLTRDHSKVLKALQIVRGTSTRSFRRFSISISEAIAFEQRNSRVITDVVERECPQFMAGCPTELRDAAAELLREARGHIQTVITNLSGLAKRLQAVDAPKTLILLSGGFPFEQESLGLYREAQRQIAAAGISVFSILLEQPDTDASNRRPGGVEGYLSTDLDDGPSNFASMTGGKFFTAIGTAAGPFERVRNAVTSSYLLGVEASPQDVPGRPLDVSIRVRRPGLSVTSALQVTPRERPPTAIAQLARALARPVNSTELPIAVSAYVVRGDQKDTLKVIVFGEIDATGDEGPPLFALRIQSADRSVFESNGTATATSRRSYALTAAQVAPGAYLLRMGGAARTRSGSAEVPLNVRLNAFGKLRVSDPILGSSAGGFRPAITLARGERLAVLIEAYGGGAADFDGLTADVELRRTGSEQPIGNTQAAISQSDDPTRRVAEAEFATDGLEPSLYSVTVRMREGVIDLGTITREIRIE